MNLLKNIFFVLKYIFLGLLELLPITILIAVTIELIMTMPKKIIELIFCAIALIALIILVPLFKKYENNTKKRKQQIKEKDKTIVENFLKKEYTTFISTKQEEYGLSNSDYIDIYEEIEQVEGVCFALLAAEETTQEKKYILIKEFDELLNSINNKELNEIYEEAKEIKKIVYKYYDTSGNWKIKD